MLEVTTKPKSEEDSVHVINSQESPDVLDQLLKPEVRESLTTLIAQLPKLTDLVNILTRSYDFAQLVATDETLKKDTIGAVQEMANPIIHTVKNIAATTIEAKDLAEESNDTIGIFGLLRLLKDPQVQKLFRFVNAYLQISAERVNK